MVVCFMAASGCTKVGPDYEPPEVPVPDAWRASVVDDLSKGTSPLETWWHQLDDPVLDELIEKAGKANLDLRIAEVRVREALALRGVASGARVPEVILDGGYTRIKPTENGIAPAPNDGNAFSVHELGIGFNWEVDFFGRVARSVEAATAQLEASIEDYRDVLVLLYAEVASSYIDVRTAQARLDFAWSNVDAQKETLQLTRDRFNAGLTSALDVAQAESNLASTEAQIPTFETQVEFGLNRIATLLGEVPGAVNDLISDDRSIPDPDPSVTVGLPAELLRRRPDIRRVERQLASQTALIGVAKADLYPTFSLSGVLALESTDLGDLTDGNSVTWSFTPGLRWNIFSGGRIRNQIRVEEARTEQAYVTYEQTVLLALEEVENAMVAYEREKVRRNKLVEAVDATQRSVELVRTQYLSGLTDFQNYLDSQRSLFNQQDQLAASKGLVVQALVVLNRALGGGWPADEASPPSTPGDKRIPEVPADAADFDNDKEEQGK